MLFRYLRDISAQSLLKFAVSTSESRTCIPWDSTYDRCNRYDFRTL